MDFHSVCADEGVADDSPSYRFIYPSFEMTLSGNIVLNGKDTMDSHYMLPLTPDPGRRDPLNIPACIGKGGSPLVVKVCLKDEGGGIACDGFTYSELEVTCAS